MSTGLTILALAKEKNQPRLDNTARAQLNRHSLKSAYAK